MLEAEDVEGLRAAATDGYAIDIVNTYGTRSLHTAAQTGNMDLVNVIMESGVSVFQITEAFNLVTAFQVAARWGH